MGVMKPLLKAGMVVGAVHLGATALAKKLDEQPDPFQLEELTHPLPGTEGIVLREDGTRLRTIVQGSGDTVVLCHDFGGAAEAWNLVAEQLVREGFRIIAFDQRGHGRSTVGSDGFGSAVMAGDLAEVMTHYDVRDATLVGHSLGAFLALKYLLDSDHDGPDRVKKLVLVAGHAGDLAQDAAQAMLRPALLKSGAVNAITRSETYGRLLASVLFGRPSPSATEALRRMMSTQPHATLAAMAEIQAEESLYPRLGDVNTPTKVLCGTADRIVPAHHSERIAARIEDADLIWLDGAGHMIPWEDPAAVVTAIRQLV